MFFVFIKIRNILQHLGTFTSSEMAPIQNPLPGLASHGCVGVLQRISGIFPIKRCREGNFLNPVSLQKVIFRNNMKFLKL